MAEKYKLTYFNLKALAEPIRLLFAVAKVDYEDVRIERESWPDVKQNFPFGQLPVLEVGDKKVSQSNAITRYLGRKFKLAGADEWEAAKIDELADVMVDFRAEWKKYVMEQDVDKKAELKKPLAEVTFPKVFDKVEAILKANGGKYLVGKSLSWVDVQYAYFLESMEVSIDPNLLDNYPNLKALKENFFAIPTVKAWIDKRPQTDM